MLDVRDLRVAYGTTVALDGLSLTAGPGAVVALAGGDGAGKTTALRAVTGLVPTAGGHITRPGRARLGVVPAGGGWPGDLTVAEVMDISGRVYRVAAAERARRATQLLDRTGLGPARRRLVAHLSGGMRAKLALAAALLHQPDLLILDEPTTGVDPLSRTQLWRLLTAEAARGAAVLLTTTYLDEAQRAGHVVLLHQGRVARAGAPGWLRDTAPGTFAVLDRPAGTRCWRRGRRWHAWWPPGTPPDPDALVRRPDLEDVAILATTAGLDAPQP